MGPWLISHGNVSDCHVALHRQRASMGPWLISHGNHEIAEHIAEHLVASMGPWLISHGNHQRWNIYTACRYSFNGAVAY